MTQMLNLMISKVNWPLMEGDTMKKILSALLTTAACAALASPALAAAATPKAKAKADTPPAHDVRIYRLDCGNVTVTDLNVFSDTDAYIGKTKDLVVSCYLIKHDEEWLLWDTGLPANTPQTPDPAAAPFQLSLKQTITQQLAEIGLAPEEINYIGISHGHFDHTGQANAFPSAKLIMQKKEYDFMTATPEKAMAYHMDPTLISNFTGPGKEAKLMLLAGDTDIFGDGTLKTISLPGHTPGHMALLVNLPKAGPYILSGDQWHFLENLRTNGVPSFNYDRADTLASSDKLAKLMKNRKAKLIIQHEPKDAPKTPALPGYLQ